MLDQASDLSIRGVVESVYETESRRVLATLIRVLGDFELAEEAMHDAFASALEQWKNEGVPRNPRAWLISTARFKGIDAMRRRSRFDASLATLAERFDEKSNSLVEQDEAGLEDDHLRLIFTCCHPALAPEVQLALTLREVCGLTTEQIASAFLTATPALAQRIVRAKAKIRDARIPYHVPSRSELPARLDMVLRVVYLVFNEGYSASSGSELTRPDLAREAIRLGRLLVELLPEAEVLGLLALMLLQDSRRSARTAPSGELVLLEDQDRSLWNREQIEEGLRLVGRAFMQQPVGTYTLQAAIAAEHAQAGSAAETNWGRIVAWYELMLQADPSPVVALNHAVARSMRDGPGVGLVLVEELLAEGDLDDYHLAHAVHADLCRRLGRNHDARSSYERALKLARQAPERRFLERRLAELS